MSESDQIRTTVSSVVRLLVAIEGNLVVSTAMDDLIAGIGQARITFGQNTLHSDEERSLNLQIYWEKKTHDINQLVTKWSVVGC